MSQSQSETGPNNGLILEMGQKDCTMTFLPNEGDRHVVKLGVLKTLVNLLRTLTIANHNMERVTFKSSAPEGFGYGLDMSIMISDSPRESPEGMKLLKELYLALADPGRKFKTVAIADQGVIGNESLTILALCDLSIMHSGVRAFNDRVSKWNSFEVGMAALSGNPPFGDLPLYFLEGESELGAMGLANLGLVHEVYGDGVDDQQIKEIVDVTTRIHAKRRMSTRFSTQNHDVFSRSLEDAIRYWITAMSQDENLIRQVRAGGGLGETDLVTPSWR
ncbi:MAG: hypothetical protein OXT67_05840 [Zetaproteobacteria bacterium]|nr:hypothetical protein [Zetaproteobacteria bacterium]